MRVETTIDNEAKAETEDILSPPVLHPQTNWFDCCRPKSKPIQRQPDTPDTECSDETMTRELAFDDGTATTKNSEFWESLLKIFLFLSLANMFGGGKKKPQHQDGCEPIPNLPDEIETQDTNNNNTTNE